MDLLQTFCAEVAPQKLGPHFEEVRRIEYRNQLVFGPGDEDDLLRIASFKLPLLLPPEEVSEQIPDKLRQTLTASLSQPDGLRIEKNDAAFHCRRPRCR
jgi:hypothetical protein